LRANITVLLIILFFTVPLFLVAYKLGVYVRDHYYLPRITEQALKKERDRAERNVRLVDSGGAQIAAKISSAPFTKINGWSRS
jgi:hypothetical protein